MIRKLYIISFCLILQVLVAGVISAQNEVRVPRSEFKIKPDSFSIAYKHIRKGNSLVKKGKGALPKALDQYLEASKYNNSNPQLSYKIGVTYLRTDQKAKSLDYLKSAFVKKPDITKNILLLIGMAYQQNMKFDTAIEKYNDFLNTLSKRQKRKQSDAVFKYIDECKAGSDLVSQPKRVVINNLGDSINSAYDDYNALVLGADSMMYFTSRRPSTKKEKPSKKDYMFDEDIYTAYADSGVWRKAKYLDDEGFNTKHNEDIVWVSDDGTTRYLYDGYIRGGDILVSTLKKGKWSQPKRLYRRFSKSASETSISITRDGNTIYFVSDNQDESFGGKDIYYIQKNQKGKWEKPKNVGSVINTKYDEEFVYVLPDGKVMYFSSKGHNTMGGYDIFRSEQDGGGVWSKPVNIGYPINTPGDEIFYRPSQNERTAYMAAKRTDTRGGFDIYKVISLGSEKTMGLAAEEQLIAYFDKPITDIFARISSEEKIDTVYNMVGTITNAKKKTPVVAKLDLIDVESSQLVATTLSDSTGAYRIRLPQLKKYGIEIHAKDYMLYLDVVNIPPKIQGREVIRNFTLAKVEVGSKIVLKNIYFESGKAVLTKESNTELDKVVTFMKDNADLKVEISGHTDNIGSQASNQKLSEARAKSVVTYLIQNGIPQEKLVYKGYGFAQPIAPNSTAAGRKLNRRVEFKILSVQ
jgi:outer membrane protein OmpA-like peptidoglycan-associated protein/tetratricopeptide (TPR) repeat protein